MAVVFLRVRLEEFLLHFQTVELILLVRGDTAVRSDIHI
jgi:hypothetical protein